MSVVLSHTYTDNNFDIARVPQSFSNFLGLIHVLVHKLYRSSRCSTCALVFGCWELSHVIFLMLRKKELLAKPSKMTTIFTQNSPRLIILNENSTNFENFLSFASSSFFLSLRKITWLNSQQPKTKAHVCDYTSTPFTICPCFFSYWKPVL